MCAREYKMEFEMRMRGGVRECVRESARKCMRESERERKRVRRVWYAYFDRGATDFSESKNITQSQNHLALAASADTIGSIAEMF